MVVAYPHSTCNPHRGLLSDWLKELCRGSKCGVPHNSKCKLHSPFIVYDITVLEWWDEIRWSCACFSEALAFNDTVYRAHHASPAHKVLVIKSTSSVARPEPTCGLHKIQ